jgi:hypothetical protein
MKRYLPMAGWALTLVFSIAVYSQYNNLQEANAALSKEQQALVQLSSEFEADKSRLNQELADLRNQLNNARQNLALARNALQDSQGENDQNQGEFLTNENALAGPGGPGRAMTQFMDNPRFQELSSRMMLNNRFGPFISSLQLSPEERDELNDILMEVINEQQILQRQMMNGEISPEEFQTAMANLDMDQTMASFLTDDELNQWYDWQDQEAERAQQQVQMAMNMQLSMQTPGLTDENRSRLAELLSNQNNVTQSRVSGGVGMIGLSARAVSIETTDSNPGDMQSQMFTMQKQRNDEIRQKLQGTMDENQMAIVNNYLEQQEMQSEMVQEMINGQTQNGGMVEGGLFISQ